jgi:hypothetical protein
MLLLARKLSKHFSDENYVFYEDMMEILHNPTNSKIQVVLNPTDSKDQQESKFGISLESKVFTFRESVEIKHKELYEDVLRRLWGKKVGFWNENGKLVSKPRLKRGVLKR